MSCNGCRVLRKRCGETCVLRSCLVWIDSAEAQGHATLFLVKFYGRSDLFSFITAAPDQQRPSLFRSLLFEACGRTINPVSGVVGLFSSGKWHVCEAAVQSVLTHGFLHPLNGILPGAPMQQDLLDLSTSSGKYSGSNYQPSDLQISFPDESESATNKSSNQQKLLNLLV